MMLAINPRYQSRRRSNYQSRPDKHAERQPRNPTEIQKRCRKQSMSSSAVAAQQMCRDSSDVGVHDSCCANTVTTNTRGEVHQRTCVHCLSPDAELLALHRSNAWVRACRGRGSGTGLLVQHVEVGRCAQHSMPL